MREHDKIASTKLDSVHKKPVAKIIFNGEELNTFPPKIRNRAKIFAFAILIQYNAKRSSLCSKSRKRNKRHTDQKEGNKTVPICR